MEQSPADARAEAVLRFARAGHDAGYPTADLEERVLAVARSFGLPNVEVSATPTLIDVSIGFFPAQRNYTLRVRPTAVDLDAIARLDDLVQEVLDGRLDADGALRALKRAEDDPARHPWPLLLVGYAIGGVALAPVLGGGWRDAAAAAVVGLVVGGVALSARRAAQAEPMVAPVAALAASFTAVALVKLGLDVSADIITLAALVTLLPGMTLTIGVRELSTEHLQSGVANTASAVVQLFGLAFGVAVGRSIATSWFGDVTGVAPHPPSFGIQLAAALVAALAFTLTLRARLRDAPLMAAATCLAIATHALGAEIFGDQAAVFVAALAIGLTGGLAAAGLRRSLLVFVVPGILMLVPGSTGFDSVLKLLTDNTASGVTAAFDTFVTAMSIAYGLMVSTVFLPRRLRR